MMSACPQRIEFDVGGAVDLIVWTENVEVTSRHGID